MVTAEEFGRSFRGAAAMLNRRPDALSQFEISLPAFWRSFAAVTLTIPAYVVDLALTRQRRGLDGLLFDDAGLAAMVGVGHLAGFLAIPVAMIAVARRFDLGGRYVPYVIVTNWIAAFASYGLAAPWALLLLGLETPALATLFAVAFATVAFAVNWHAARGPRGVGPGVAGLVTGMGLALSLGCAAIFGHLA